ncbi:hypothetical protein EDB86DRAFT_3243400 [Lactarius hatsudake]|nr:hypothetical protein EDB86DRAFT_3243400 [Lactarius hatsudake]
MTGVKAGRADRWVNGVASLTTQEIHCGDQDVNIQTSTIQVPVGASGTLPSLDPPDYGYHTTISYLIHVPKVPYMRLWIDDVEPSCQNRSTRRQERDRHELVHVPYFIHCPLPHCAWRGNRADLFKKHWQQEDHRSYHEYYGRTPEQGHIETFDPWVILKQIINGAISLREGEDQAIVSVQVKAYELQKSSMWLDPWGRNKRHLMGQTREQVRVGDSQRHTRQFGLGLPRPLHVSVITFATSLHTHTRSVSLPPLPSPISLFIHPSPITSRRTPTRIAS